MTQHEFEQAVMRLWTTSLVPMTRANVLAYSKVERSKLDAWLDAMVRDGLLELDSDDDGEMLWTVRGAKRPEKGISQVGQLEKLRAMEAETGIRVKAVARPGAVTPVAAEGQKSLVASGALSFFFGPLGWLYAAPLSEALPGALVYLLICGILPKFLLVYVLGVVSPLSGIAGVLYAWSHNRVGRRAPLFLKSGDEQKKLLGKKR